MNIEEKQLAEAARELVKHIGDARLHQEFPSHTAAEPPKTQPPDLSDDTNRKCLDLIDSIPLFSPKKPLRGILVSAVLIVLMTVGVFAFPQIRSFVRKNEDLGVYTEIRFRGTGTDNSPSQIGVKLSYIPSGYTLYKSTDTSVWYTDPTGEKEFMVDAKAIPSGAYSVSTISLDTENAEKEDITINGNKGIILRKRVEYNQTDRMQIYWEDPEVGAYFLLTFLEMDETEAFKILDGIEYKGE